jgi:hypothetical protein
MTSRTYAGRRPLRRPDLWSRQTGGEFALYDADTSSVHLLNETAWAIWGLCDGETTPDEMIESIAELSRLPRDLVSEDVDRVLSQFAEANLVTWVSDLPGASAGT